jgi:hypothetical protein
MPPPAPRLTRVRLIPSVFVKRTRIAFTLRGGDRVSVAYARLAAGRVLPAGRLAVPRARPGANLLTLVLASARGLPLRAGAYRLTVTPRAADGRAGPPVRVPFRIVPRAR